MCSQLREVLRGRKGARNYQKQVYIKVYPNGMSQNAPERKTK